MFELTETKGMTSLPLSICQYSWWHEMYNIDIGIKVLSMKINYLVPFKHKHQKLVHENELSYILTLHGIDVMKFSIKISYLVYHIVFKILSMKISYLASVQCVTEVPKRYP
jgi:hypothetical protein